MKQITTSMYPSPPPPWPDSMLPFYQEHKQSSDWGARLAQNAFRSAVWRPNQPHSTAHRDFSLDARFVWTQHLGLLHPCLLQADSPQPGHNTLVCCTPACSKLTLHSLETTPWSAAPLPASSWLSTAACNHCKETAFADVKSEDKKVFAGFSLLCSISSHQSVITTHNKQQPQSSCQPTTQLHLRPYEVKMARLWRCSFKGLIKQHTWDSAPLKDWTNSTLLMLFL